MTDDVFSRMTPEELANVGKVMYPPTFTIGNILAWTFMALVAVGFVVGRWWFYGWLYDHTPRWVSVMIAGA